MLTETQVAFPPPPRTAMSCQLCGAPLGRTLLDLGRTPLPAGTRRFGEQDRLSRLHVLVCDSCLLVQVRTPFAAPLSMPPPTPAAAGGASGRLASTLIQRLGLGDASLVVEIAAGAAPGLPRTHPGGVPVLAETPAFNAAAAMEIAARAGRADLVLAINVLPLAPDLFDFAAGLAALLRPKGIAVLQTPHLLPIMRHVRFDAFRHDRRCYLSLGVIESLLRSVGLRVVDAEMVPDHGGSLRVHACHPRAAHAVRPSVKAIRQAEAAAGLDCPESYDGFAARAAAAQEDVRDFIGNRIAAGRRIAAYGLATRGTALLNACGIGSGEVAWVADPGGAAKGRYLPGCGIPVVGAEALLEDRPSDLLILPWHRAAELAAGLQAIRQKGTQFWVMTPTIRRV